MSQGGPGHGGGPGPQPAPSVPSAEPVGEFLTRRERELTQQIDSLRGQITPKEQEREQIRKAMRALGLLKESAALSESTVASTSLTDLVRGLPPAADLLNTSALAAPPSPYSVLGIPQSNSAHSVLSLGQLLNPPSTIKQMALSALRDHFHQGATPAELRDYIKTAYGRDVERSSISPQLARLRDQGAIQQHNDGRWSVTTLGRLSYYPTDE
jgi:hypothetical protein